MKPRIVPTGQEVLMNDGDIIISKTDLQGRITYANRVFMRIASYPERDLLNVQHNIIRHPDMPRGAFKLLWNEIKAGREFFAYVKNLASTGHHYWVFANVTPDYDARGNVVGYFSVRRKPKRSAIAVVESVYQEMLAEEKRVGPATAPDASIALLEKKLKTLGTSYDRFVLDL